MAGEKPGEDRVLANGAKYIDFQTDPSRYRHWKLAVDGDVATLTMDVDENGGLFEGYQLKLNSYDLGVDIELADAVQRLRFEHPRGEGGAGALGQEPGVLRRRQYPHAGRARRMRTKSISANSPTRPATAWRIPRENSGQRFITVVNGTAAGGGYELALATDHIILADDGAAAVALPEVPLLAVLPGTGGLTRVVDKRKVRRDHADFFCTIEEGIKGKRAVHGGWSTRSCPTASWRPRLPSARRNSPQARSATAHGKGVTLTPLKRTIDDRRHPLRLRQRRYRSRGAHRDHFDQGAGSGPAGRYRRPDRAGRVVLAAAGGARTRRRDPASAHQRTRNRDAGVQVAWRSRQRASPMTRFLEANKAHWLVNEIRHYWKRVLKRIDVTSRTLVTLVEPGSCFVGTLAELVFAADRSYMLIGSAAGRQPRAADDRAHRDEFRSLSDEPWPDPAAIALPGRSVRSGPRGGHHRHDARCGGGRRTRPRHLRARRHRLGRRGAGVPRGAHQLLARQPHRHGSQSALRRSRDHGIRKSSRA